MVEAIADNPNLQRPEQLYQRFDVSPRQCQRWFSQYLGVTCKWVLGRYRIFEALDALDSQPPALAELALRLGYSDQAHFSRLFRQLVGRSPRDYLSKKAKLENGVG